jgi:hypothetical protein
LGLPGNEMRNPAPGGRNSSHLPPPSAPITPIPITISRSTPPTIPPPIAILAVGKPDVSSSAPSSETATRFADWFFPTVFFERIVLPDVLGFLHRGLGDLQLRVAILACKRPTGGRVLEAVAFSTTLAAQVDRHSVRFLVRESWGEFEFRCSAVPRAFAIPCARATHWLRRRL